MYNITEQTNGVKITDGTKTMLFPKGTVSAIAHKGENQSVLFPKGTVSAIAHKGENQSVDLRLMASRKNIISFPYDNCNMAEQDAEETAEAIGAIL